MFSFWHRLMQRPGFPVALGTIIWVLALISLELGLRLGTQVSLSAPNFETRSGGSLRRFTRRLDAVWSFEAGRTGDEIWAWVARISSILLVLVFAWVLLLSYRIDRRRRQLSRIKSPQKRPQKS